MTSKPLLPRVSAVVLFCLGLEPGTDKPVMRPATVVRTWPEISEDMINVQVLTDGNNDDALLRPEEASSRDGRGKARSLVWRTSVHYSAEPKPGCWSWPPLEFGAVLVQGTLERTDPPAPKASPIAAILQFFRYDHLPPHLQAVSKPFCDLAQVIAAGAQNAESTVALRKLMESKDAAVRALLFKAPELPAAPLAMPTPGPGRPVG